MKRLFPVICMLLACQMLTAQCECPPLPEDEPEVIVVNVSTVSELQNALSDCNANGGYYTILLEDGIYELTNNLLYIGQNMSHLTIRSASGDRDAVTIQGQGMGGNVGWIFNVAADHFTVADMTIGWVANHPIQIHAEHDADDCLVQNVRIVDAREQMLKVSGSSSPTFSDRGVVQCCLFEFPDGVAYQYYTGGIDAHRAKDWEIRNNVFKHIRSPDNGLAEHAIHLWSESENTLVENNLIINCDRGIGFGLGSSQHFGGIIRNNFVHTSRDVGIGLESAPDVKVYNNTVVTDNYFNSIEYRFEATHDVHIANNLVNEDIKSRNGGTGLVESNYQTSDQSIFVDAANHDYHLGSTDPNIVDVGIELADVELDYDCHPRDLTGLPDIGADEFESVINNTNNLYVSSQIQLYPNPAYDQITIQGIDLELIKVRNSVGDLLLLEETADDQLNLDVSELPIGIYFLEIKARGKRFVRKVVKE